MLTMVREVITFSIFLTAKLPAILPGLLYQQKESITGRVASQSTNTKLKNYV